MRALGGVLFLIGFTAVVAQVLLLRELLVLVGGNEITLGLALAAWLLWTGLGSALAGRWTRGAAQAAALLEILAAAFLPAAIVAARLGKAALQRVPGEIYGPGPALAASLALLAPFCLASGGLFACGSRHWRERAGASTARATGTAYLLEAAGSATGGVLAGLWLTTRFVPLQTALLLAAFNFVAAAHLLGRDWRGKIALGAAAWACVAVFLGGPEWDRRMTEALWRPLPVLATANSPYGSLVVAGSEGARTLYENGQPIATAPDPEAAEEAVHFGLLQHPSPHSVLLIGGGLNGSLAEALKHPSVARLDYVELDPAMLRLGAEYLNAAGRGDPRVAIHNTDGRLFLHTTAARYDVVLVNLPEPSTAKVNRYYTLEFFREAQAHMRPDGVLSLRLSGAENYIGPEQAEFLRSIHRTLHAVFHEVTALPGSTIHLFACEAPGTLLQSPEQYGDRLRARGIKTIYASEPFLRTRMTPERVAQLRAALAQRPDTAINRDFAPVAYYFSSVLWSAQFRPGAEGLLAQLRRIPFPWVLSAAVLAALLGAVLLRGTRATTAAAVATMGLVTMTVEVLLLLGFQAIHGVLYQRLAVVIALFMSGMAVGGWAGLRARAGNDWRRLARVQAVLVAAPLGACALLGILARGGGAGGFAAAAFLGGLAGGYQFPVASRLFFGNGESGSRHAGLLYGLDLVGSAAGAVLLSAWLVPLYGFWKTAAAISVFSLASLAAVRRGARGTPAP